MIQPYNSQFHKWTVWCAKISHNPSSEPASDVASLLVELHKEGYQASFLNAFRSAIFWAHDQVGGMTLGKHPLLCSVLKVAFHATCRPPLLRYTAAWNVQAVLKYLKSIGLSSMNFPFTQVSHLQDCNTADINNTLSFHRPNSTATRFKSRRGSFPSSGPSKAIKARETT